MNTENRVNKAYEQAKEVYLELGIDTDAAIKNAGNASISVNCWQGDDVIGFDSDKLTGGISTTGNYPGRATNPAELRQDIDMAMSMIPGIKRLNLHASYAEKNGKNIDRDEYTVDLFKNWMDWSKEKGVDLDFNPTFFSHEMMDGDLSLASHNDKKRKFWIEHGKRSREIGAAFGKAQGNPCALNFWMPDGMKDLPADTSGMRELMIASLDEIFADKIDKKYLKDAIESKLFGLGIESFTVASHEFSLLYAATRNIMYTLDAGHFHPTEVISAKISAVLSFMDEILLHVSRPVRWDSDHVVLFDDEMQAIMKEIVRGGYVDRVHIGLDFFDASINRIAAWVIGTRNAQKGLLYAFLEPSGTLRDLEREGNFTKRLALLEEGKTMPFAAVWDYYCMKNYVPVGTAWIEKVEKYEKEVLSKR